MATTVETTAMHPAKPLRRRVHLTPSHSTCTSLSCDSVKDMPSGISHAARNHTAENIPALVHTYDSSASEYSDRDLEPDITVSDAEASSPVRSQTSPTRARLRVDTSNLQADDSKQSPISPTTRAWYEFDLAVVVALVSPIGNWLTGGDHIKNLLLIVLLIFYLHQIIEIPWALYHKSRPRRRPSPLPALSTIEELYRESATSELRTIEFGFLFLTCISPFLGACLLRYATEAVIGLDAVSWFSTGLFVLATGMRPWAHVIERLTQRTTNLHDVIHYPSPEPSNVTIANKQTEELLKRVSHLERALGKMKMKMKQSQDEVFDYVDDAVEAIDQAIKRQEKKCEKHEVRFLDVEETLKVLKSRRTTLSIDTARTAAPVPSILTYVLPTWLHPAYNPAYSPLSTSPPRRYSRSFSSPISPTSTRLEPIPEEANTKRPPSLSAQEPQEASSGIIFRAGYVATMPLRAIIRMVLRSY